MQIPSPIQYVRKAVFGATQADLAAIGEVSRSRVSRYETGEEDPPYRFLNKLRAEALRRGLPFSAEWFFDPPRAANAEAEAPKKAA